MASKTQTAAQEHAARENKAARWSAYFYANDVHSSQVMRMEVSNSFWAPLAASISRESGRKLAVPHTEQTILRIVACLRDFEDAKRAADARQGAVAFDARNLQEAK